MYGNITDALKLIYAGANAHQPDKRSFTYLFSKHVPSGWIGGGNKFNADGTSYAIASGDYRALVPDENAAMLLALAKLSGPTNFSYAPSGSTSADIVIFGLTRRLYQEDPTSSAGAQPISAMARPPLTGGPNDSDIIFMPTAVNPLDTGYVNLIALHELSHALGLMHALDASVPDNQRFTIMSNFPHPEEKRTATELQLYDVAALQRLYGRDDSFNSGATTYSSFTETSGTHAGRNRMFAIWDGGGVDTIDASATSGAALIDLRPGFFSSIGTTTKVEVRSGATPSLVSAGTLNISIAFGAYIENAIGTSKADLIIGNLLSNRLEGGAGDDVIYGEDEVGSAPGIHDSGQVVDYNQVDDGEFKPTFPPLEIIDYVHNPGQQTDTLLGGDGNDYLRGGRGDDTLSGGGDDDILIGGAGNDIIWGGDLNATSGVGDGHDMVDYSAGSSVSVAFDGTGATPSLTVTSATTGTDTLHFIDEIILSPDTDAFTFTGVIPAGYRLKIDAGEGQYEDTISLTQALGASIKAQIVSGGVVLTSPSAGDGQIEIVNFGKTIVGSNTAVTQFVGAGTGMVFRAGAAGGDFTLGSSDRAYGREGVQDIFRLSTTAPSGLTNQGKVDYLASNRVFLGDVGAEDLVYVDGVLFNGNRVTAASAAPIRGGFLGGSITSAMLTGDSSFGVYYPVAAAVQLGLSPMYESEREDTPWFEYLHTDGDRVRDVSLTSGGYEIGGPEWDEWLPVTLMTFLDLAIDGRGASGTDYQAIGNGPGTGGYGLADIAPDDAQLVVVMLGFEDGEAGVSFSNDTLANVTGRASPFAMWHGQAAQTALGSMSGTLAVIPDYLDFDGNADGYTSGGGATIGAGQAEFNQGAAAIDLQDVFSWQNFVAGHTILRIRDEPEGGMRRGGRGNDQLFGFTGPDSLLGGAGSDWLDGADGDDYLDGGDGDDVLIGGTGSDVLFGGSGSDIFMISAGESGVGSLADCIADFSVGIDKLDLSSVDANGLLDDDQAFAYVGSAAFSGSAAELRYQIEDSDVRLQGDTDGDGAADFEIVLSDCLPPPVSDFYL